MDKAEFVKLFCEIMSMYNEKHKEWIDVFGNDKGFDEWFTKNIQLNR